MFSKLSMIPAVSAVHVQVAGNSITPELYAKFLSQPAGGFQVNEIAHSEKLGEAWVQAAKEEFAAKPACALKDLQGWRPEIAEEWKKTTGEADELSKAIKELQSTKATLEQSGDEDDLFMLQGIDEQIAAYQLEKTTLVNDKVKAIRSELSLPANVKPLTKEHKQTMRGFFNEWVDDAIATFKAINDEGKDLPIKSKFETKFWMGGQPFWKINAEGVQTEIAGYEILFRHAAIFEDKMHVAPAKTFFTGRSKTQLNGISLFGAGAPILAVPDLDIKPVDSLQTDLVNENDCRLVQVQVEWAKYVLTKTNGKIGFITINVRPDEYTMTCTNTGVPLVDEFIAAKNFLADKGIKSKIIYELTEYAKITAETEKSVAKLREAEIDVWADDVAAIDFNDKRAPPAGLKGQEHATDMSTVQRLMPQLSGHKLASEVCIQLTDKRLNRFPATNADRVNFGKSGFELDLQFGPVGVNHAPLQPLEMEYLVNSTEHYLRSVRSDPKNNGKVLVIENSSGPEELDMITKLTGQKITGKGGCWAHTLIQGGSSADLALAPQDLMALHGMSQ